MSAALRQRSQTRQAARWPAKIQKSFNLYKYLSSCFDRAILLFDNEIWLAKLV